MSYVRNVTYCIINSKNYFVVHTKIKMFLSTHLFESSNFKNIVLKYANLNIKIPSQ